MITKTCKQCGEIKPVEQFRRYYGGRKGTYTMCRQCERINSREKYLTAKGESLNYAEEAELDKIHKLYEYQRKMGLQPPQAKGRSKALKEDLDDMLSKFSNMASNTTAPSEPIEDNVPYALSKWLTITLDREPDYYLDEVYERLRDTYRPLIRVDAESMLPVYDDTYKATLDKILERFNEYEDNYYEED